MTTTLDAAPKKANVGAIETAYFRLVSIVTHLHVLIGGLEHHRGDADLHGILADTAARAVASTKQDYDSIGRLPWRTDRELCNAMARLTAVGLLAIASRDRSPHTGRAELDDARNRFEALSTLIYELHNDFGEMPHDYIGEIAKDPVRALEFGFPDNDGRGAGGA